MDTMDSKAIKNLADSIWKTRGVTESRMDELARFILPDRQGFQTSLSASDEGRADIYDATPESAAQMLAAAMGGLLTNPATDWFSLDIVGEEAGEETGAWLTDVARITLDSFADVNSQFQEEVNTLYLDLPVLGWGVFFSSYTDGVGLNFTCIPPSECAIAENARGRVDTVVRRYTQTASQLAEEFGKENCSQIVQDALDKDAQKPFVIMHLVTPQQKMPANWGQVPIKKTVAAHKDDRVAAVTDTDEGKASAEGKPIKKKTVTHPFVSLYLEEASDHILHVGGFFEFPYAVPRWSKRSGEVYGRGPGQAALPDIRVLNIVSKAQMASAEKMSDPPLMVPDDSVVGRIRSGAGGVTYYRPSGGEIFQLPVAGDLATMQVIREEKQAAIRTFFLNDRIQMAGGPQMSATEALIRERRQHLILGPVMGRMESDFLGNIVERAVNLLLRAGRLPTVPEALQGRDIRIQYVSPISRAQKQGSAESFTQAINYLAPVVQIAPQVLDHFDADTIARDTQDLFGYPQTYLLSEAKVQAVREERAKQAAEQAQAQAAQAALQTAGQAAGAAMEGA